MVLTSDEDEENYYQTGMVYVPREDELKYEDRQEILKYLSTQPYANVFKLVAIIVGLKKAPEGKNNKDKKEDKPN